MPGSRYSQQSSACSTQQSVQEWLDDDATTLCDDEESSEVGLPLGPDGEATMRTAKPDMRSFVAEFHNEVGDIVR